jgi:uncharacterized damage-inducible protein DinB
MNLSDHFHTLARYNRIANERLYEKCSALRDTEYRMNRAGSFGSIHGLLNHILLGDRIWMSRFEGGGQITPPLNIILYEDFSQLRDARVAEDARIESFFGNLQRDFAERPLAYINNQGKSCVETVPMAFSHFFNHQTHHRGQVHVMLSQTPVTPPSLDLLRMINP